MMAHSQPLQEVLFVDDSEDEHLVSRLMMRRSKLAITYRPFQTVKDFEQATSDYSYDDWRLALVLFDLNLTLGSGIAALKSLKANNPDNVIIAGICTGSKDPKDRQDAFDAGANFFITKPFDIDALRTICDFVPELALHSNDEADGLQIIATHS